MYSIVCKKRAMIGKEIKKKLKNLNEFTKHEDTQKVWDM